MRVRDVFGGYSVVLTTGANGPVVSMLDDSGSPVFERTFATPDCALETTRAFLALLTSDRDLGPVDGAEAWREASTLMRETLERHADSELNNAAEEHWTALRQWFEAQMGEAS